ncbi:MAG: preprotein translocase subunit SecE [Muribaculaceae bacterium]|nr:preprotein translocase subunit SecE [Muribaculaceae bacterium]
MKKYKLLTDIEESYNELVHKVSWPTRKELVNSTIVVMVASIISAIAIWLVDLGINFIMERIYNLAL